MTPNTELAAAIRRLHARLAELDPERELQPRWNASWDELTRQREAAPDEQTELDAMGQWEKLWPP